MGGMCGAHSRRPVLQSNGSLHRSKDAAGAAPLFGVGDEVDAIKRRCLTYRWHHDVLHVQPASSLPHLTPWVGFRLGAPNETM
jgi:hypothetical protein